MRLTAPTVTGSAWLNTAPLHRDLFYGRVTAVVFWTVQCEASAALLAHLERLQQRLGAGFAVIAVHSPRFADQTDQALVADQIGNLRLRLPVVHDPKLTTWGLYDPPGWPSIMLVDHRGKVIGSLTGATSEAIDDLAETAMAAAEAARHKRGKAARPLPIPDTPMQRDEHALRHPSGLASLGSNRLAVVDSGNDRLLIGTLGPTRADDEGLVFDVETIIDGFEQPARTVAIGPSTVAVSEPSASNVVLVDISTGTIWPLDIDGLVRPLGLAVDHDGSLVIADPGAERLFRVQAPGTAEQQSGPIAGSGASGDRDGRASRAELSQPVDAVATEAGLVFCDKASSTVRLLTPRGRVLTSSSKSAGPGLIDGPLHRAAFDRPNGVTVLGDGSMLVAEAGSGRLRSLRGRRVSTLGLEPLGEPGAIVAWGEADALVVDSTSHRIVRVQPERTRATQIRVTGIVPRVTTAAFSVPAQPDDFDLLAGVSPEIEPQSVPMVELDDEPIGQDGTIRAATGTNLAVEFPALGSGPWRVTITAEPSSLIEGTVSVERAHADDLVTVTANEPGPGTLVVMVSGSGDGHRAVERHSVEITSGDGAHHNKTSGSNASEALSAPNDE